MTTELLECTTQLSLGDSRRGVGLHQSCDPRLLKAHDRGREGTREAGPKAYRKRYKVQDGTENQDWRGRGNWRALHLDPIFRGGTSYSTARTRGVVGGRPCHKLERSRGEVAKACHKK